MSKNVLVVESLSAGYGQSKIVDNVALKIHQGEIFGLIGLNGVGKTTLIKTILGLRQKLSGDVDVGRKDQFSYLPERFDPPHFLSGYNFLKFSLNLYKKNISKEEAREAFKSVSLNADFLNKRVHTYSKGMRQKLGLLATFLTEAPLLILDEPMSGLDPKARDAVKKIIQRTKREGRSVFMSSHILSDMDELCDRVAVFHDSSVIFTGTPEDLRQKGSSDDLEKAFLNLIGG